MSGNWIGYNDLAWVEPVIAPPEQFVEETEQYCALIKKHSRFEPKTLLHLGSGAGMNDYTFKNHFKVTGVDLSEGMLREARKINQEVDYHPGDMRTIKLGRCFDAVVATESIGYMTNENDLRQTLENVNRHLHPDGVFILTTLLQEGFRENNFVYTGSKGDLEITVLENNYRPGAEEKYYEATIIYLVRISGDLEIYTDRHILGLFAKREWLDLLEETGFKPSVKTHDDHYAAYIMGEGDYRLHTFICNKTAE